MQKKGDVIWIAPESLEGARSATGSEPGVATELRLWSAEWKNVVVLRPLRSEPVDSISREISVPIYKLEEGSRRLGELVMEVKKSTI
jgi:hypothetical protein